MRYTSCETCEVSAREDLGKYSKWRASGSVASENEKLGSAVKLSAEPNTCPPPSKYGQSRGSCSPEQADAVSSVFSPRITVALFNVLFRPQPPSFAIKKMLSRVAILAAISGLAAAQLKVLSPGGPDLWWGKALFSRSEKEASSSCWIARC